MLLVRGSLHVETLVKRIIYLSLQRFKLRGKPQILSTMSLTTADVVEVVVAWMI